MGWLQYHCSKLSILLALTVTPSKQYNSSRMSQKTRTIGGRSLRDLKKPFWFTCVMVRHSSSVAAAGTILSHVIGFCLGSLPYMDVKVALTVVSIIWEGLSHRVPDGYREAQSDAKLNFPRWCFICNLHISVLFLKFKSLGFNVFQGLIGKYLNQSTVTRKSRLLSINIRNNSSPCTRANASPSIGA